MVKIQLDLTKSLHENANQYFSKAKKLKSKLPGIEKTIEKTNKEIEELSYKQQQHQEKQHKQKILKQYLPKHWYDKFRHTYTSQQRLVVMGKDAGTNELLIKKHMEEHDIVFHTTASGSPFALVKQATDSQGNLLLLKSELEEVAQFICAFSSQWKRGFGTADCFWVYPSQVTKESVSGEYISRGSFMVYGKKNELKNVPLQLALGVKIDTIETPEEELSHQYLFSGSKSAVLKFCGNRYVILEPGQDNYKKIGKDIKKKLNISIDNLPSVIPNDCRIVKK